MVVEGESYCWKHGVAVTVVFRCFGDRSNVVREYWIYCSTIIMTITKMSTQLIGKADVIMKDSNHPLYPPGPSTKSKSKLCNNLTSSSCTSKISNYQLAREHIHVQCTSKLLKCRLMFKKGVYRSSPHSTFVVWPDVLKYGRLVL